MFISINLLRGCHQLTCLLPGKELSVTIPECVCECALHQPCRKEVMSPLHPVPVGRGQTSCPVSCPSQVCGFPWFLVGHQAKYIYRQTLALLRFPCRGLHNDPLFFCRAHVNTPLFAFRCDSLLLIQRTTFLNNNGTSHSHRSMATGRYIFFFTISLIETNISGSP